jgi:hypothetical protein
MAISRLDLPPEALAKPQVWTRYLLKQGPNGLLAKGYTKPKLQTFYDQVGDAMNDSKQQLKTYASYVWFNGQWVRI